MELITNLAKLLYMLLLPVTEPSKSVLLASVPPSMFITLGAASASVILLVVLVAALYIRRVRKRDGALAAGASLRSSLQLDGEEEYVPVFIALFMLGVEYQVEVEEGDAVNDKIMVVAIKEVEL